MDRPGDTTHGVRPSDTAQRLGADPTLGGHGHTVRRFDAIPWHDPARETSLCPHRRPRRAVPRGPCPHRNGCRRGRSARRCGCEWERERERRWERARTAVIVRVASTDDIGTVAATANASGASVGYVYDQAFPGFSAVLPAQAAAALTHNPHVVSVEPDMIVTADTTEAPTPSWGLDRVDQHPLALDNSYSYSNTGVGVTAYIVDTGIRASHQEFVGRVGQGFTAINDGQGTQRLQRPRHARLRHGRRHDVRGREGRHHRPGPSAQLQRVREHVRGDRRHQLRDRRAHERPRRPQHEPRRRRPRGARRRGRQRDRRRHHRRGRGRQQQHRRVHAVARRGADRAHGRCHHEH